MLTYGIEFPVSGEEYSAADPIVAYSDNDLGTPVAIKVTNRDVLDVHRFAVNNRQGAMARLPETKKIITAIAIEVFGVTQNIIVIGVLKFGEEYHHVTTPSPVTGASHDIRMSVSVHITGSQCLGITGTMEVYPVCLRSIRCCHCAVSGKVDVTLRRSKQDYEL